MIKFRYPQKNPILTKKKLLQQGKKNQKKQRNSKQKTTSTNDIAFKITHLRALHNNIIMLLNLFDCLYLRLFSIQKNITINFLPTKLQSSMNEPISKEPIHEKKIIFKILIYITNQKTTVTFEKCYKTVSIYKSNIRKYKKNLFKMQQLESKVVHSLISHRVQNYLTQPSTSLLVSNVILLKIPEFLFQNLQNLFKIWSFFPIPLQTFLYQVGQFWRTLLRRDRWNSHILICDSGYQLQRVDVFVRALSGDQFPQYNSETPNVRTCAIFRSSYKYLRSCILNCTDRYSRSLLKGPTQPKITDFHNEVRTNKQIRSFQIIMNQRGCLRMQKNSFLSQH
eukprot:TRINITY_DN28927_c0_g1_i1.p1 TRINITY_DN28927_c0_g1~~TRINITY_DN28927_c0_g1_i1.p1  ORF type:complete len:337 (-),score=-13.94 TRINITY_DN28927_c0_g1_i1:138-1148(-)